MSHRRILWAVFQVKRVRMARRFGQKKTKTKTKITGEADRHAGKLFVDPRTIKHHPNKFPYLRLTYRPTTELK